MHTTSLRKAGGSLMLAVPPATSTCCTCAPARGDIYLVSLDPTSGREPRGTRPVVIVSPSAFNRLTKTPVVLPITRGGNFARTAGFAVSLTGAGTETTGIVRCDQPRAIDLGALTAR